MDKLGEFRFILSKLIVYPDRVEIKSPLKTNIIPSAKIANVSFDRLKCELLIETSGGSKTKFRFGGFSAYKKGEEALRLISSLK